MPKKTKQKISNLKPENKKEVKSRILNTVVKEIKDRFGEGSIMKLGEAKKVDVDAIPTGSLSLDLCLGIGGIPKGRIIEVYGAEASGKTTLVLHIVAEVQKKGGLAAFVDAEHALDPEYARKIGVNVDDLLISQPDSAEQALDIVETLIRSGAVDAVVVDSVAALAPQAEIEGKMGELQIGLQARIMSQALRKITAIAAKTGASLVFVNQTRMKIGIFFGDPTTTPGGKALKFYSSVRIEVKKIAQIKKGDEVIGIRVRAKVVKNKTAPPFKQTEFDIIYNEGISRINDLINTGLKYEVLKRTGNWYEFDGQKLGQGQEMTKEFLKKSPQIFKNIEEKIKEKYLAMKSF